HVLQISTSISKNPVFALSKVPFQRVFDFAFEERLPPASTLPSALYTAPAVLEVERAKVFGRTWQLVGREQQAASPGQFFTCAVADEPIVVARGLDDKRRPPSTVRR